MKKNTLQLSKRDIEEWTGTASFHKGEEYFDQGRIINPEYDGMLLRAWCAGSYDSYQLHVTLDSNGIVEADCSCPVGEGGYCKHVAALLLTWLNRPDDFRQAIELDKFLENRSKPDLIALIRQMLRRNPDLDYLLALPPPSTAAEEISIDPRIIRKKVSDIFNNARFNWSARDISEATLDLDELLYLADQYQENGNIKNAISIYRIVSEEMLQRDEFLYGEGSETWWDLLNDCATGLGICLKSIQDIDCHKELVLGLLNIYLLNVEKGGIGVGEGVLTILREETTPLEKELVNKRVRDSIANVEAWGQQELGRFFLNLNRDSLDDDTYLEICRETGRTIDLVEKLLQRSRLAESLDELQNVKDHDLIKVAELFERFGHGSSAVQWVSDRVNLHPEWYLLKWLRDYYVRQADLQEASYYAIQLFWKQPCLDNYLAIKEIKVQLTCWPDTRTMIINKLHERNLFQVLIDIYLKEGEIGQAIETLDLCQNSVSRGFAYSSSMLLNVARAAENDYPHDAIRFYLIQANQFIDHHGRDYYVEAIQILKQVQRLYVQIGKSEDWLKLILEIRNDNRRLRALHDELNKAGF